MKFKKNGEWKDIGFKVADTLPVGSIVDFNGSEVPSGWEEVTDTKIYTEEEQVVGAWIDGKPLYRKVLSSTTISGSDVDITLPSNIDFMSTDKVEIKAGGFSFFSDRYTNANDLIQIFKFNATTLRVVLGSAWKGNFKSATIVIEYTKTTD